jgi:Cd2+/Zn2+-exporting ATPase
MHETFRIPALDCSEELGLIEKALAPLPGVGTLQPNYLARTLRVEFDQRATAAQIAEQITRAGFPAEVAPSSRSLKVVQKPSKSAAVGLLTWIAAGLLLLAFICWAIGGRFEIGVAPLAIAATFVAGVSVAKAAWRAIRLRALDMNVLMTIAAVGALGLRDWFEAATAMLLFNISLWLEQASMDRARRAVQSLVELSPPVAHRMAPDGPTDVTPDDLLVGERVLVKPGERIPVDGLVVAGESSVNQDSLNVERMDVEYILCFYFYV